MTDDKYKGEGRTGTTAKASGQDQKQNQRAHRLKLALRENLKRRKSQTRGRSGVMAEPSANEGEPAPDESGRKEAGQ
jgi:hypothetical protein